MEAQDFFKKEEQIYNLIQKVSKGEKKMIHYVLSKKFVEGLTSMVNLLGVKDKLNYSFDSEVKKIPIGGIIGFKIDLGFKVRGDLQWDKIVIYHRKIRGLKGVIYTVRKNEKGEHDLINKSTGEYIRKPDGFIYLEKQRDLFRQTLPKNKDEISGNNEPGSQQDNTLESKVDYLVKRLLDIQEDLEDNNAVEYKVYGVSRGELNQGKSGKWESNIGFGIEGKEDNGNKIKPTKESIITVGTQGIQVKELYFKVSKNLYRELNKRGVKVENRVNYGKGFMYIKSGKD